MYVIIVVDVFCLPAGPLNLFSHLITCHYISNEALKSIAVFLLAARVSLQDVQQWFLYALYICYSLLFISTIFLLHSACCCSILVINLLNTSLSPKTLHLSSFCLYFVVVFAIYSLHLLIIDSFINLLATLLTRPTLEIADQQQPLSTH